MGLQTLPGMEVRVFSEWCQDLALKKWWIVVPHGLGVSGPLSLIPVVALHLGRVLEAQIFQEMFLPSPVISTLTLPRPHPARLGPLCLGVGTLEGMRLG